MKANINIFYTENIKFSLRINSELLNFDYQVNLYDFESKKFINENLTIKYTTFYLFMPMSNCPVRPKNILE